MRMDDSQLEALWAEVEVIRGYARRHSEPPKGKRRKGVARRAKSGPDLNEPQTSRVMVEPILARLGWGNSDDRDSLWREFELSIGRVDFACRIENKTRVTVECKKFGTDLRNLKHATQACHYAYECVASVAVLTDGAIWSIYDTFKQVPAKDRLVRSIDIRRCSKDDAREFFSHITMDTAREGEIKIRPAAVVRVGYTQQKKEKPKQRFNRVGISSPEFKAHIAVVMSEMGNLKPLGTSRNTYERPAEPGSPATRFCVAAKTEKAQFNLPGDMIINCEKFYLARLGDEVGWFIPSKDILDHFKRGELAHDQIEAKSHTLRMAENAEGKPVLLFPSVNEEFVLKPDYRRTVRAA